MKCKDCIKNNSCYWLSINTKILGKDKALDKDVDCNKFIEKERMISSWEELSKLEPSETHKIEVNLKYGNGEIINLVTGDMDYYLSTHTFYGIKGGGTPNVLKGFGWNIVLDSWEG